MHALKFANLMLFLSTLSLRRATRGMYQKSYPHSISIHALLAESDRRVLKCDNRAIISIHALLAESDYCRRQSGSATSYFYPRSPCGERLVDTLKLARPMLFLSTLSLRRATEGAAVGY